MILIGMFDSPFVRRVAVSMNLLGIPFEHRNWSVGRDFELIRQFNPLGRVPALVQADGDTLIESSAILDFLDEQVGAQRPWVERCHAQTHAALAELDRLCQLRGDDWLIGSRMTQVDITATCVYTFLSDALGLNRDAVVYPALAGVAARCEALPEFKSVKADWFAPSDP
jgi:glutathione S-transferase